MNVQAFTNPAVSQWRRAVANKHTSGAAVVFAIGELINRLTAVWLPAYTVQMDSTVKAIQHFAIIYGLIMAGDAGATATPSGIQAGQIQPPQSIPPPADAGKQP